MRTYEARFDRNRNVGNAIVRHYLVDNTDKSTTVLEFLNEAKDEVVDLLNDNPSHKAAIIYKVRLVNPKDPKHLDDAFLRSKQYRILEMQDFGKTYDEMWRDVLESFEAIKLKESGWAVDEVTHFQITFAELAAGKAGHFVKLPNYLRLKHAK